MEYAFLAEEMEEENPVQYKYIQKRITADSTGCDATF